MPQPITLHVSPSGNDRAAATSATCPLATPAAALHRVRKLRARQPGTPVTVEFQPGLYQLTETLRFTPDDLGTAAAPIVWRSSQPGAATLTGCVALNGFQDQGEGLYKLDLATAGQSGLQFNQLFCDGQRLTLARWPKRDPANPVVGGWLFREGDPGNIYLGDMGEKDRFCCRDPRLATWSKIDEVELFIFPRYGWKNDIVRLQSYDPASGEVRLAEPCTYEIYPNDRFYFRNIREECTEPGEWYLDREHDCLWLRPPGGTIDDATVLVPTLDSIIEVQGRGVPQSRHSHPSDTPLGWLRFEGFVIEGCDGAAAEIADANHIELSACEIRNAGVAGVRVRGGYACRIVGCDVHALGGDGVCLEGGVIDTRGTRYLASKHEVHNCHIHHVGMENKHSSCIQLQGCGNAARRNLAHDSPRYGINFKGCDHRIEANIVRHTMTETADGAAIHACHRDHSLRGTRIRANLVLDTLGFGRKWQTGRWRSPHFSFGIYLDDYTNGVEISQNVVVNSDRACVFIHDGRDNTVENNLLAHARDELYALRRQNWWREFGFTGTHQEGSQNNIFRRNLCIMRPEATAVFSFMPTAYEHAWPGKLGAKPLPGDGLTRIPKAIEFQGSPLRQIIHAKDEIDLANLFGGWNSEGLREHLRIAYAYRMLESEVEQTARMTMAIEKGGMVWLNGKKIFDNAATGSSEFNAANNVVLELPLRPGQNLLAVRCTSGFVRWRIVPGWPAGPHPVAWAGPWQVFGVIHSLRLGPNQDKPEMPAIGEFLATNHLEDNLVHCPGGSPAIQYNGETRPYGDLVQAGHGASTVFADPLVRDLANGDFSLSTDSPAHSLGFVPLPLDRIGPYDSPQRCRWPLAEAPGVREHPTVIPESMQPQRLGRMEP